MQSVRGRYGILYSEGFPPSPRSTPPRFQHLQQIQIPENFQPSADHRAPKYRLLDRKLSIGFGVDRRLWIAAAAYVVLLALFEAFYLRAGFISLIEWSGNSADPLVVAITALYALAAFYLTTLLVLATMSSRWPWKVAGFLLVTIAVVIEFSYSRAIGRFTNALDVGVALSATRDQQVYSAFAFLEPSSLLAVAALAGVAFIPGSQSKPKKGPGLLATVLVLVVLFSVHLAFVNPVLFDRRFSANAVTSLFQTSAEYLVYEPLSAPVSREAVETPQGALTPQNNIVVIFDESIRGDHLSLNGYERATTPLLDELRDKNLLSNFGIAVSGATSSAPSFHAFVSGAPPDEIAANGFEATSGMPTIFQYAKAMGYRTFYIDGQRTDFWWGRPDDAKFVDRFMSSTDLTGDYEKFVERGAIDRVGSPDKVDLWELDTRIAETVREIYSGSTGNFIFVYKRGTHIPYQNAYPESETMWKPAYNWDDYYEIPGPDKVRAVINSYDNAIRYNVDGFFRALATDYSNLPNNTVIAYTSDHGQSLFAQGAAGHGGSSREEANVPMFLIGLKDRSVDTSFKASHSNLFTSLLDLMEYPETSRRRSYAVSLFKARGVHSAKRFFNPGGKGKVAFDQ
jgi:glucan phosphoethanolaminetransferase (alkaline phosphatase superfamily)